jgi:hypothetical protein
MDSPSKPLRPPIQLIPDHDLSPTPPARCRRKRGFVRPRSNRRYPALKAQGDREQGEGGRRAGRKEKESAGRKEKERREEDPRTGCSDIGKLDPDAPGWSGLPHGGPIPERPVEPPERVRHAAHMLVRHL